MHYRISSLRDVQNWVANHLDVDEEDAKRIARAIWDREDFPHPVNNTDLTDYLGELDMQELLDAAR